MMHYPFGRVFELESLESESSRFMQRDISPTGVLSGNRVSYAKDVAGLIENSYIDNIKESGNRRYAWIFVEDIQKEYIAQKAHYELSFFLPKGSYATNVLDVLKGGKL
jgi:tRNA pseudouridine13 synthase